MYSGDLQSREREYEWHGDGPSGQAGGEDLRGEVTRNMVCVQRVPGKDVEGLEWWSVSTTSGSTGLDGDKCLDDKWWLGRLGFFWWLG